MVAWWPPHLSQSTSRWGLETHQVKNNLTSPLWITSCLLHRPPLLALITLIKEIASLLTSKSVFLSWSFLGQRNFVFLFCCWGARGFLAYSFFFFFFYSWLIETDVIQEIKLILLLVPKNVKCKQCNEQEIEWAVKWRGCWELFSGATCKDSHCDLEPQFTAFAGLWPRVRGCVI